MKGAQEAMARYRVLVTGRSEAALADLVRQHRVYVVPHTAEAHRQGGYSVEAVVEETRIPELEGAGFQVQRYENLDETGRARQAEVGQSNRYHRPAGG